MQKLINCFNKVVYADDGAWIQDLPSTATTFLDKLNKITQIIAAALFAIFASCGVLLIILLGVKKALAKKPEEHAQAKENLTNLIKTIFITGCIAAALEPILGIVYGIMIARG